MIWVYLILTLNILISIITIIFGLYQNRYLCMCAAPNRHSRQAPNNPLLPTHFVSKRENLIHLINWLKIRSSSSLPQVRGCCWFQMAEVRTSPDTGKCPSFCPGQENGRSQEEMIKKKTGPSFPSRKGKESSEKGQKYRKKFLRKNKINKWKGHELTNLWR